LGVGILPHEHHANRVMLTEIPAKFGLCDTAHKTIGHLQQQATAVTGLAIRGNAASMSHAGQGLDRCLKQPMAWFALYVGN
jgi:hypothetical protein